MDLKPVLDAVERYYRDHFEGKIPFEVALLMREAKQREGQVAIFRRQVAFYKNRYDK